MVQITAQGYNGQMAWFNVLTEVDEDRFLLGCVYSS